MTVIDQFRWAPGGPQRREKDSEESATVVTGRLEAVLVEDGLLIPGLHIGFGHRIALHVPDPLRAAARLYLCDRVEVTGRLRRNPQTGRSVLDLTSIRPFPD